MALLIQSEEAVTDQRPPVSETLSTVSSPMVSSSPVIERVYRHRLPVRISHWLNVPFLIILIMSGLQIFNAHPALYWGDRSDRDQAVLSIRPMQTESGEEMGITTILGHKFDTTGVLGYSDGMRRAFPAWATIPSAKWLAMGRQWHLFFAWLFVLNGLIFTAYAFASRHATRDLAPTGKDLRGIGKSLSDHLLLRHPSGKEAKRYNVLQKLAYACILFGVARSTAYYQPTPVSDPVLALMRWIDELYLQYPFAGARMLRDLLRQEGHAIGRRRVATLMRRMGITAVYRTPCTTQRHPAHRIYPYSLRGLDIARPRHLPSNGSVNSWRHEAAIHGVHY